MERTRNIPIALKTTQEVKDKLALLTSRVSEEMGCQVTQTQVIEQLVSNALKARPDEEEIALRNGHVANHAFIMNCQAGHSARLQMQTQLNANKLADLLCSDICIRTLSDAVTTKDRDGNYISSATGVDGNPLSLDMNGRRMFDIFSFVLGYSGKYYFENPAVRLYYEGLKDLIDSYTDLGTVCDHGFSIVANDSVLLGMGYAPYFSKKLVSKGITDKDIQMLQSTLDAMLGLAIEYGVFGCEHDDYVVRVLRPKDSIFMPDIGDGEVSACTILFLPYREGKRVPML